MGQTPAFGGIYVPLITPLDADGSVAIESLRSLAAHYLVAGARGIVCLGTTGEPATLTPDERKQVANAVADVCREHSAQFILGVGTNSTDASVEDARNAASIDGLTALLSVTPYYTRPSEDGMLQHFAALGDSSPVPVIVYNIPYRTGVRLSAASLCELAKHQNIAGVKQSVGGVDVDTLQLFAQLQNDSSGFNVLSGEDAFIFPMMNLGATGAIAAASHICTEVFVDLVDSFANGNVARALKLHEMLLPLAGVLFCEPNPSVTKAVLAEQGLIPSAKLRLPMTSASKEATQNAVRTAEVVARNYQSLTK